MREHTFPRGLTNLPTWTATIAIAALTLFLPVAAASAEEAPMKNAKPDWQELDKAIAEGLYQQVADQAAALRKAALERGDEKVATAALIREAQARIGLDGFETAARMLLAAPRPETPRERFLLELFQAEAFSRYFDNYQWMIRQRELQPGADPLAIERWTIDQVDAAIQASYARTFADREAWGEDSVASLGPFVEAGSYPAPVRASLRDLLSLGWAQALADSGRWTPAQHNETYQLDLAELLQDARPLPAGELPALQDRRRHPLLRLAAILGDLEAWHLAAGRADAAFDTRLERLRHLAGHFNRAADQAVLRAELEKRLAALGRRSPWWALGMATLAEWQQRDPAPDALRRAHATAKQAAEAHPDSPGGQQARAMVDQLEMPQLELMAMRADNPGKSSLVVDHVNVPRLHFRAYADDALPRLERGQHGGIPDQPELAALLRREPLAAWQVELDDAGDFRQHRTHLTPPLEKLGGYLLVASTGGDFALENNLLRAIQFQLSDLLLISRFQPRGKTLEVEVRSASSGVALAGTEIELREAGWRAKSAVVRSAKTDAAGRLTFELADRPQHAQFHLLARRPGDSLLQVDAVSFYNLDENQPQARDLIYTDRAVYRPGQKVLFKVVGFERPAGPDAVWRVTPNRALEIKLFDPNGQEVGKLSATTNVHGSASGEFEIPTGRLLGGWSLSSGAGMAQIRVEEYKRPTFEVSLRDPAEPLRLNRPAKLEGEARYYFGGAVRTGTVAWRVKRQPIYPWWWWRGRSEGVEQEIAAGRSELDAEGRFQLEFLPAADERLAEGPERDVRYRYLVSADLTDEGGETRSAERAFHLGFVAVDAEIAEPAPGKDGATRLVITRRDLDGRPQAGRGRLLIYQLPGNQVLLPLDLPVELAPEQEAFALPGDRRRARYEADYDPEALLRRQPAGREVFAADVVHGEDGRAVVEAKLPGGAYRAVYRSQDDFGAELERRRELVALPVLGSKPAEIALPLPLFLQVAEREVPRGGEAVVVVGSGLDDLPLVVDVFQGDRRLARHDLPPLRGLRTLRFEAPGDQPLAIEAYAVRDHQLLLQRQEVAVGTAERRLEIALETFRDRLLPGQQETWTLAVRRADGNPLDPDTVELLALMFDRSLDLFARHQLPDPASIGAAWRRAPLPLRTSLSAVWPFRRADPVPVYRQVAYLQPPRLVFFDTLDVGGPGYGGGPRLRTLAMPAPAPAAESAPADAAAPQEFALKLQAADAAPTQGAPPPPPPPPPPPAPAEASPRSDFAETAFFLPHLLLDDQGGARLEFKVPESLTSWHFWVLAHDVAARSGQLQREVRTAKELMVRPYLPRFLREGDRATLRVAINNGGEKPLEGTLDLQLLDPATGQDASARFGLQGNAGRAFSLAPGGSATLEFALAAPTGVGEIDVKAIARAGAPGPSSGQNQHSPSSGQNQHSQSSGQNQHSDGELRPLPLLPSRLHLVQSRFAALRGNESRELVFEDLRRGGDPSLETEKMVATVDGQLFHTVLGALPYLIDFPYSCTEQTLNRFVSTGIVASLFDDYPAIAALGKQLAADREGLLALFDRDDPNRTIQLEESPWRTEARFVPVPPHLALRKVLDPEVARALRAESLADLAKDQHPSGAFSWWPGGPPSPFMTLLVLQGLGQALEFGVEVPREVIVKAWSYLRQEHEDTLDLWRKPRPKDVIPYDMVWLAYVLSIYPDLGWTGETFTEADRKLLLDGAMASWQPLPPRVKAYLALALDRAGRNAEARRVFAPVMAASRTSPDLGTYWQPEERSWLFYHDAIETHALALRVLAEVMPEDERRHGLVQWLMLNKKLNQWKSTRATAEVIYSLVKHLEREGALLAPEKAIVEVGGERHTFDFAPEVYRGRQQVVVPGEQVVPERDAVVRVERQGAAAGMLFASATWHFATDRLPVAASGDFFQVERRYFRRVRQDGAFVLETLKEGSPIEVGDQLEVELEIKAKHAAEYVHLRDPRGAGFEPEDTTSGYDWQMGVGFYREIRDSATNFFFDDLPAGTYTFRFRLRAATAGQFRVGPATLQAMYAPEFNAYSAGAQLVVK